MTSDTIRNLLARPGSKSLASAAVGAVALAVFDPGPFTLAGLIAAAYWTGNVMATPNLDAGTIAVRVWDRVKMLFFPAAVPVAGGVGLDATGVGNLVTTLAGFVF